MTQKLCGKAINRCYFAFDYILINIKLKKFVTGLFLKTLFNSIYHDKYITQKMCDKAVDDSLAALKLIPD